MFVGAWRFAAAITSPSARKVWIEITFFRILERTRRRHLPRGRCGLKYIDAERNIEIILSPSARKVWIEISIAACVIFSVTLSPSARKVWIEICR